MRLAPGRDGDNEMDEWIIMVDIAEDDNDYQTQLCQEEIQGVDIEPLAASLLF